MTSLAVDKNRVLLLREWRGNDEEDENSGDNVNASHVHVSRSCDVITTCNTMHVLHAITYTTTCRVILGP